MRIWKLTPVLASVGLLLTAIPAAAEPLNPKHVSAEAKWVIHIDLDALTETTLVERVRSKHPQLVQGVKHWFQENFGIDPGEDLHGVTMSGQSYKEHSGSLVLLADYDQEKVEAELKKKDKVETETWNDHTIYKLKVSKHAKKAKEKKEGEYAKHHAKKDHKDTDKDKDKDKSKADRVKKDKEKDKEKSHADRDEKDQKDKEKKDKHADKDVHEKKHGEHSAKEAAKYKQGGEKDVVIILLDGKKAVFAATPETAKATVKLLKGETESLEGKDSKLVTKLPDGAVAYGAAIELEKIERHEGVFPVLQQHKHIVWSTGERDGKAFENLTLVAQSEDVAKNMKETLDGLVAFMKVWAGDDEALKQVTQDVEITRDGDTVTSKYEADADDAISALQSVRERLEKWHAAKHSK